MLPNNEIINDMKETSSIELDGVKFTFSKTIHKNRLLLCAFLTKHAKCLEQGNIYDMIDDEKGFAKVEEILNKLVIVDGKPLKSHPDFWEDNAGIYIEFIIYAMTYYSLPFMKGRG